MTNLLSLPGLEWLTESWATQPSTNRSYPAQVERWRPDVAKLMPESLRSRPDAPMLVDKALHVIDGESKGNPGAVGDGGVAHGLFQSHYVGANASPEQQIADAWSMVLKNPEQWTDWGEGATYQGKPFGALGNYPYANGTPEQQDANGGGLPASQPTATLAGSSIRPPDTGDAGLAVQVSRDRISAQQARDAVDQEQTRAQLETTLGIPGFALSHEEDARYSHGPDPVLPPPAGPGDPGIYNLPPDLQGNPAVDPGMMRDVPDTSNDVGIYGNTPTITDPTTPPAPTRPSWLTEDSTSRIVPPAPDMATLASGTSPYGQIAAGEAGAQPDVPAGYIPTDAAIAKAELASKVAQIDKILPNNASLGTILRDTRIADIPYADKVQQGVTDVFNSAASAPVNASLAATNEGLNALGLGRPLPSAGSVAGGLVPTNVRDAALMALPEVAKAVGETQLAEDISRAITGQTRIARNAGEGATVLDEAGNVVQDARQAAGPQLTQRGGQTVIDEAGQVVQPDTSGTNALVREFEAQGMSEADARAAAGSRSEQVTPQQQMGTPSGSNLDSLSFDELEQRWKAAQPAVKDLMANAPRTPEGTFDVAKFTPEQRQVHDLWSYVEENAPVNLRPKPATLPDAIGVIPELKPQDLRFTDDINVLSKEAMAEFGKRAGSSPGVRGISGLGTPTVSDVGHSTVVHEIAHNIWSALPESMRARWVQEVHPGKDIWEYSNWLSKSNELNPTSYASTNAAEDFAESFAVHRLGSRFEAGPGETVRPLSPARQRFLSDVDKWLARAAPSPAASEAATPNDVPLEPVRPKRAPRAASSGGAAQPPATTEAAPVNFDDVRGKFLKAAQEERNARATGAVNRQIAEGRSAQAGGLANVARQGGTLADVGAAARQAAYQGGTLRKTFLKPIQLSPDEEKAVVSELSRKVDAGEMSPFDFLRMVAPAESANPGIISKLTSNAPKLMPHEVRLIRRLFGDEVANHAAERSDLSLEPKMSAAEEQRILESIRKTEARIVERTQVQATRATQAWDSKIAKAQETEDARDIRAANREKQRAIDAEERAMKAELDETRRYLAGVDRANERARLAGVREDQRATVQQARGQEAIDLRDQRNQAAAEADEMKGNLRALDAMTKVQYDNPLRQEHLDNMRALNAMWDSSYDGIYRKAEEAASAAGTPNVAEILRYQLAGNRAVLDRLTSPDGLARIAHLVRSAATGDLADSYLTALQRRTETLRSAFVADGMDPEIAHDVATTFRDAELRARYGSTTMPPRVKAMLDEMKAPAYGDSWGALDKFIQRWKNTVYSTDFGVVGTQLKAAIDRGNVSGLAGYVNRTLAFLNLPHADLYSAQVNLPKQIRNIMDGLYVGGAQQSGINPGQGTLFSYLTQTRAVRSIPGDPGQKFDAAVEWLMDKGNAIQFKGILGHARDVSYEGNLAILKMLGRDINNPRVRRTAADYANATSLFAQQALNSTRGGWERRLVTSVPMMRSEVANILQMAKFFNPTASAEERILASTSILSRIVGVLLVGKALNDQFGMGDYVMNPFAPGFGQVTTALKDSSGRNVIISMFPQQSLVKAVGKAVLALKDADTATAGKALLQGISGRFSLPATLAENVAGYGYDNAGSFHTGDLHLGPGGVLQKLFAPPIGSQFIQDKSNVYLGAQTFGVSAFPEGTSSVKDRQAQQMFVKDAQGNIRERQPGETGAGPNYADLWPENRNKVDKSDAVTNSKAATGPSPMQAATDAAHAPIKAEVDRQEALFKQGQNTKALKDVYGDASNQKRGAAYALANQFADTVQGFNKTQYTKALDGYYALYDDPANKVADGLPNAGGVDTDKVASAQKDYLASLPADQKDWITQALGVTESNKTPLQQRYDTLIDNKKAAGYFDIKPGDPNASAKRTALDKAHPEIDAESWLFGGTASQSGGQLESKAAVDQALGIIDKEGLSGRSVHYMSSDRDLATPEGRKVWADNGDLIQRLYDDANIAAKNKPLADYYAKDRYKTTYDKATPEQQRSILSTIRTDDILPGNAQLDALHAYLGFGGDSQKKEYLVHSNAALEQVKALIAKYGNTRPKEGWKYNTTANAR